MTILSRIDVSIHAADTAAASLDLDISSGSGVADADLSVAVAGLSVKVGLDRLLNSYSPVEHLLNGPDALARFRAGAVPADPAPVAERGMSIRLGDPNAPVATHYAVSVALPGLTAARADLSLQLDTGVTARAEAGTGTRGVASVRDTLAAVAIPARIDGPSGGTAAERGIGVVPQRLDGAGAGTAAAAATNVLVVGGTTPLPLSFAGLVNLLGQGITVMGPGLAAPHQAPPGAVLAYQRGDGMVVVELRTATGYAGLTAATTRPLSQVRSDAAYVLTGVFAAANAVPPPDGSDIPAGQPAPPGDRQSSFGDYVGGNATDRPYLHAIWYDILAQRFAEAGVDLQARSAVLRDAVWATAMEHGPFASADAGDVLSRLERRLDLPLAGDAEIITAIFEERARLGPAGDLVHYPEVLPFDQQRLIDRLAAEAETASRRVVSV